jgi:hypothetical protein
MAVLDFRYGTQSKDNSVFQAYMQTETKEETQTPTDAKAQKEG